MSIVIFEDMCKYAKNGPVIMSLTCCNMYILTCSLLNIVGLCKIQPLLHDTCANEHVHSHYILRGISPYVVFVCAVCSEKLSILLLFVLALC